MRNSESIMQILHQRTKQRPTPTKNLGRASTWEGPRPIQEPTTQKAVMRRAHQGAGAPQRLPPGPSFHRQLHGDMLWRFRIVSYFFYTKPTMLQYKRSGALLQHTPHLEPNTSPLYLYSHLHFSSSFVSKARAIKESLAPRKKGSLL